MQVHGALSTQLRYQIRPPALKSQQVISETSGQDKTIPKKRRNLDERTIDE
jgi:hypothetical protein